MPAAVVLGSHHKGEDVESGTEAPAVSVSSVVEHIHQINDMMWKRTCFNILKKQGPDGALAAIRDKFSADASMWGVVSALYATISVAFLLVGPSNYSSENKGYLNQKVNYVYVACNISGALFNTIAVFVSASTYAFTAMADDSLLLLKWIAFTRNPRYLGLTNCITWQNMGNLMLMGSIMSLAFLLHGPHILAMAGYLLLGLTIAWMAIVTFMSWSFTRMQAKNHVDE